MKRRLLVLAVGLALVTLWSGPAWAEPSACEECHQKVTPGQVADFNRSVMSEEMTCAECHGQAHQSTEDVDKAQLPTIASCGECHQEQADEYLSGKHALGLIALEAMPYTHQQPQAFVQGQKGCGGCHTLGLTNAASRQTEGRQYYKYGLDCQNCHTRHSFSKAEASEPEACMTCHMGFDHAQWEMWSGSKHGVTYLINRAISPEHKDRAPRCQTCHMPQGNHRVFSAWRFLAVRLPEEDQEWMGYRTTILKRLGVLDPKGQPTNRLEAVKAAKMARLSKAEFDQERARFTAVCQNCHSPNFVEQNMKNADLMVRESDRLLAEAIEVVAGLYQEGLIAKRPDYPAYPDLLTFYDVNT
ncbi:MAG: cytochrome C, partial [Deltaproteobacteria bacterium]|nr:cytochrome C [Deltaproteobacteria bacterium]